MKLVLILVVSLLVFAAPAPINGIVFWALFVYLIVRAWPSISADLSRVPALRRPRRRPGRYSVDREGVL